MTRSNAMRSWWKPWTWSMRTWLFAIALSVLASPLVMRGICLWQIPDVVLPSDGKEITQKEVPDDQNAFAVYSKVLTLLAGDPFFVANNAPKTDDSKPEISREEMLERLFGPNEQALTDFIRAGEMEQAVGPSLETTTFWTDLSFHQNLRQLTRHFRALGQTFEERGEIEKAWACHRANLQLSIHTEQPGFAICALIGIAMRAMSSEGIVHWAANSSLSAERLQAARNDITHQYARRMPISTMMQCEDRFCCNTINELEGVEFLIGNPGTKSTQPKPYLYALRALFWCVGEPELVRRLNRQILLNNTTEIDKPFHMRRHSIEQNNTFVFDLDPNIRKASGQLDAAQLARILASDAPLFRMTKSLVPAFTQVDQAFQRDTSRLTALTVLFAAQEFQRSHGEYPETLEQLVPTYLDKIPFDPMNTKGEPMHYRREADGTAIVWSNGLNGIDDQGAITLTGDQYLDTGYLIKLNGPVDDQPAK